MCWLRTFKMCKILFTGYMGQLTWLFYTVCIYSHSASHLLDPRSRREFAFDMPVDGENAIGEEKPDRGSAADRDGGSWLIV